MVLETAAVLLTPAFAGGEVIVTLTGRPVAYWYAVVVVSAVPEAVVVAVVPERS